MTPMTPLGVKPQLWLIVWLGPPKTPNGPPRGALCCTHRTQGNIHFFLLQWNIGGPEWPPNDPHDPPNKFAMFLGSNCAPQWGNKKFHDLVTVILSGNYLYAMLKHDRGLKCKGLWPKRPFNQTVLLCFWCDHFPRICGKSRRGHLKSISTDG